MTKPIVSTTNLFDRMNEVNMLCNNALQSGIVHNNLRDYKLILFDPLFAFCLFCVCTYSHFLCNLVVS